MTYSVVWQKVEVSGVNSPILWGNVWLFVLWVPNIFRQKAQNASDVWTQYVQWEHVLAKYQLVSAICCNEHMSARLAGRGEKICRLPGPEGTDPSRVPDNQSKHHHWAAPTLCSDWSRGSEMTMNESHLTHETRRDVCKMVCLLKLKLKLEQTSHTAVQFFSSCASMSPARKYGWSTVSVVCSSFVCSANKCMISS